MSINYTGVKPIGALLSTPFTAIWNTWNFEVFMNGFSCSSFWDLTSDIKMAKYIGIQDKAQVCEEFSLIRVPCSPTMDAVTKSENESRFVDFQPILGAAETTTTVPTYCTPAGILSVPGDNTQIGAAQRHSGIADPHLWETHESFPDFLSQLNRLSVSYRSSCVTMLLTRLNL
ncbi:hypothetical protein D915_009448 [Fasciola hepatica]|uniref:Uncharacterized protein n=1 Tax=Fasciola hepatica TaxID=6192 RepID=A0A4E0R192_FASHE|nr:hypothetical protein D915_009448 [Fasciola hepatica]